MDLVLKELGINIVYKNNTFYSQCNMLGKLLTLSNIRDTCRKNPSRYKLLIDTQTNCGIHKVLYLHEEGVKILLCISRKPVAIELCQYLKINTTHKYVVPEASFVLNIQKSFNGENIKLQYKVENYILDMYFIDYNLSIEFDEKQHKFYKENDLIRENEI